MNTILTNPIEYIGTSYEQNPNNSQSDHDMNLQIIKKKSIIKPNIMNIINIPINTNTTQNLQTLNDTISEEEEFEHEFMIFEELEIQDSQEPNQRIILGEIITDKHIR